VSEDLLSRDPNNEAHRARLRRALEQLGEPVPEMSGAFEFEALPIVPVPARPAVAHAPPDHLVEPPVTQSTAPRGSDAPSGIDDAVPVDASADAPADRPDVASLPGALAPPPAPADGPAGSEVDLSLELSSLSDDSGPEPPQEGLDHEFARRRDDLASARTSGTELLKLAQACRAAGLFDDAVAALHRALKDPAARLDAAASLGELFLERGERANAAEWLAVAAEVSGMDEARRVALLRRLVGVLEELGERERALAVWLEILTLAPSEEAEAKVAALVAEHGGEPFAG
jgi:hypothetical protein